MIGILKSIFGFVSSCLQSCCLLLTTTNQTSFIPQKLHKLLFLDFDFVQENKLSHLNMNIPQLFNIPIKKINN
jgi:hypothetical protein